MIKDYLKYIKSLNTFQKVMHFGVTLGLIVSCIIWPFILIIIILLLLFIGLYSIICNSRFTKEAVGNGIIYGGRGAGKGLLLNKRINTDSNKKHFTNIPYNKHSEIINVKEYIDSILPNTTEHFINNKVVIVDKISKYEGINIYWDDVGVYAPNFNDSLLKKEYPSLSALLPINRHTYNAHMIITVQDIERPYKILRELQTDFSIKAIKSHGWGQLWRSVPILALYSTTKYIYYENNNAARAGLLPFNAKNIIGETAKHGYLTAGQATKETYEATNGRIRYGRVIQLKKNINYDTRYFHKIVFGETAKDWLSKQNL